MLLSHSQQDLDNNPLDNLADLREIHQFEIDLSNYTDHEAVESDIPEFNDHFDILPDMDTRDYHNNSAESSKEQDKTETLSPALYDVVTAVPTAEEAFDTDSDDLEINGGMDDKYFTLLENLRKKIMAEKANGQSESKEIHLEENDIRHPLISLMAIKPNSMRLLVKPKTLDVHSMVNNWEIYFQALCDWCVQVRLMYKRVPRNKAPHRKHLDDPIIEIVPLYRYDQEHYIHDLPRWSELGVMSAS